MNIHKCNLCLLPLLFLLVVSSAHAGFFPSAFKDVNKSIEMASTRVKMQTVTAKNDLKNQDDPKKVQETATVAIDNANTTAQEAFAEQKTLVEAANAKVQTRESVFSASLIGLFISNGLTIFTLVGGRKRSKMELRGLELENEKKELELQELRRRRDG